MKKRMGLVTWKKISHLGKTMVSNSERASSNYLTVEEEVDEWRWRKKKGKLNWKIL